MAAPRPPSFRASASRGEPPCAPCSPASAWSRHGFRPWVDSPLADSTRAPKRSARRPPSVESDSAKGEPDHAHRLYPARRVYGGAHRLATGADEAPFVSGRRSRPWRVALDWLLTLAFAFGFLLIFQAEVAQSFRVPSASMEPTLQCAKPAPDCTATFSDHI